MKTYCVTGATGYIGSWLVNSLLQTGYKVHATVRNLERASSLFETREGTDRLSLFRADLQEDGSFDEAVRGCDGVFHIAASMEFHSPAEENFGHIKTEIIDPAIKGTLNLLKACVKFNTIKKVVFTSSISTLTAKDDSGQWIPIVDESCRTSLHQVLEAKANGWVYVVSKLSAEEAAFQFAKENDIDLISVITTTVGGPFLIPSAPASVQVLLSPITGDQKLFSILSAVNLRMGSTALVHIEDICCAHIFLMKKSESKGRYICCTQSCTISQLVEHLIKEYPCSTAQRWYENEHDLVPVEISSKKIRDLGFSFKYGIQDIIHQTVEKCIDCGFLTKIQKKGKFKNPEI